MQAIKAGQVITVQVADYCMVSVRRPSGIVETIRHPSAAAFDDILLARANKQMAAAGRGEIIGYVNVTRAAELVVSEADAATDLSERIERAMQAGERMEG